MLCDGVIAAAAAHICLRLAAEEGVLTTMGEGWVTTVGLPSTTLTTSGEATAARCVAGDLTELLSPSMAPTTELSVTAITALVLRVAGFGECAAPPFS